MWSPFLIGAGNLDHLEGEIGHQKPMAGLSMIFQPEILNLTMEFCGLDDSNLSSRCLHLEQVLGLADLRTGTADALLQEERLSPSLAGGRGRQEVNCFGNASSSSGA